MILLGHGMMQVGDSPSCRISRFEVRFVTPVGLFMTREQAVQKMNDLDIDPMAIKPVAVAIGEDGGYEVCM